MSLYIMIFPLIVLLVTSGEGLIKTGLYTSDSNQEYRLERSLIYKKQVSSVLECAQWCLFEHWRCRSINYRKRNLKSNLHECELNNETRTSKPERFVFHTSYDYYELHQLNEFCKPSSLPTCYAELRPEKSCFDFYKKGRKDDGVYSIDPDGRGVFQVRCDMTTDGGGWTVFQRRLDGSVDFYRGWSSYQKGFGDWYGEYWLGLDNILRIIAIGDHVLRIDLGDFQGNKRYAVYEVFKLSDAEHNYTLNIGNYSGNAGDSLQNENGMMFSTKDRDNDMREGSCAIDYRGAWWYSACHRSCLNGNYLRGKYTPFAKGITWYAWKKSFISSLKEAEMKIRPRRP